MEWEKITTDIDSVDWGGNSIVIHSVPAIRHVKTGKVKVDPKAVAKAEFIDIAKEIGIQDRDIMLFLLLYAKPGPFQRGYLCQKYKINKMLFYQWKELERIGLGDVIPRDEFEAKSKGPVPENLWEDLKRLKEKQLLKVDGSKKEKKTVTVELTDKGVNIARKLWNRIPDPYLGLTTRVKDILFPMNPEAIKEMVHEHFPEFRKTYKQEDREETIKI